MSDFVAWMPEGPALDALESLCAAVPSAFPGLPPLRFRARAQFHMTLRFLAEGLPADPAPLYAALADVAAQTPRLALRIDRIETWPGANVLVARTAPDDDLATLFARLDAAARACGHAGEARPPSPHITLAYAATRERLPALPTRWPSSTPLPLPIATEIGSIALARTAPARYDTVHWWPLGESGAPPSMHLD